MKMFLNCNYIAVELRDKFLDLDAARANAMTIEEILIVRNYIMAYLLLTGGGNRGNYLRSMALKEFNNKFLDPITNKVTVCTFDHKTKKKGAAITPFLSPDLLTITELYGTLLRPKLVARRDMGLKTGQNLFGPKFEDHPEKGDAVTPFFLSKHGHYLVKIDVAMEFIKKVLEKHCEVKIETNLMSRCFRNWFA